MEENCLHFLAKFNLQHEDFLVLELTIINCINK